MKRLLSTFSFVCLLALAGLQAQYEAVPNALGVRMTFVNFHYPNITADGNRLFRTKNYSPGLEVEYVRHIGRYFNVALPLTIGKGDLPINTGNADNGNLISSFEAQIQIKLFQPDNIIYPYLYTGAGGLIELDNDQQFDFMIPAGLGLNIRIGNHFYWSNKGQYTFSTADLRDNIRFNTGFLFILGQYDGGDKGGKEPDVEDTDGDGVSDVMDECPEVPGTAATFGCPDTDGDGIGDPSDKCPTLAGPAELDGCPDADGDGVTDKDDDCPNLAGPPSLNGCPDTDGDGIIDRDDQCPTLAGTAAANGCPDADNDGIPDNLDRCPDVAGPDSAGGCPDDDGDGIDNATDRCPNTAGPATSDGCPEISGADKEKLELAKQAVEFETSNAVLLPESYAVLDDIADILRRYADFKLRIGGHTDSVGSSRTNLELSEQRAKACYDYLVSKGIDPARMSYIGYGETKPIANNKYEEGRAQNRRVEFDLYN